MATDQLANHTCGDSRLACVDCAAQVCPSCFVPCPVGNRCRTCAGATKPISRPANASVGTLKKQITCFLFGGLCGWLVGDITFGFISFCFAIAFWAAGRETGSQIRRGNKELAVTCILPFLGGLTLGTVGLYFFSGVPEVFLAWVMNVGAMAFGFILGKCGFG